MSDPQQAGASCPLCNTSNVTTLQEGVRDMEYGAPGEYTWVRCADCQLVRLSPFPTPEVLGLAYPTDYHAYVRPSSAISRALVKRSLARVAKLYARRLPAGGGVLEVGCSDGLLLEAIGRHGEFTLEGVEYDATMAQRARDRGLQVWQGDLADAELRPESMDLVIMQHVLEHVWDPIASLRTLANALRPGGQIVGELPNLRSWDAALFGRYWGGGHAPRHLWHFTPATLRRSLEHCGFEEVRISYALHTGHWALSIQNWLRRRRSGTEGLTSGRAGYYPLLLLLTIPINMLQLILGRTGVMRFQARKKAP